MRKFLVFLLLVVVLIVEVSPEGSCCSDENQDSTASIVFSDTTDNSPISSPVSCECPQCISCLRCGHLTASFGNLLVVAASMVETNNFTEQSSFFGPSPYISGLKRPPIA